MGATVSTLEDTALADYFYWGPKPEVKDRLADLEEWTSLRDLQPVMTFPELIRPVPGREHLLVWTGVTRSG